jgi:hypothetical protein
MLAGGSAGLLAHPLRHLLTLLLLGSAIVGAWPGGGSVFRAAVVLAAAAGGVVLTSSASPVVNVLAAAVVLVVLAFGQGEIAATWRQRLNPTSASARVLLTAASAVGISAVFCLALASIPMLWHAADCCAGFMGRAAGLITGHDLRVGASFGGMGFLVLMAAFYAVWLGAAPGPRLGRAVYGAAAIIAAQAVYLCLLAWCPAVLESLPRVKPEDPWSWAGLWRAALPWNVPAVGCLLQLAAAWFMIRWSLWQAPQGAGAGSAGNARAPAAGAWRWRSAALPVVAVLSAILLPVAVTLSPGVSDLRGKKVVLYEKGFLNWLKPEHGEYGRLSVGMYGMFPTFVESLGGRCVISPDLSESDLAGADVVIVIYPNKPWQSGQLDRLWRYVRRGGSLMLFGEHTTREKDGQSGSDGATAPTTGATMTATASAANEKDGQSRFDEVLAPTAMRVAFDSAMFQVGGWLHSYEGLSHSATAGIRDDRNAFGVVIGASLEARWPARPLVLGRWGWCDSGDEGSPHAMMGNRAYDAGERLGDVVLAAEQRLDDGRIVAFGDTSTVQNAIMIGSHAFVSRLLGYLAGHGSSTQDLWRGVLGLLLACGLVAAIASRPTACGLAWAALALAAATATCLAVNDCRDEVVPSGRHAKPNNLAYIDNSHLETYSEEGLRDDGVLGLELTLMRNGYLVMTMPEFSAERLSQAGMFISIAPAKPFSGRECLAIRRFVEGGGIFILTAGWDDRLGCQSVLREFDLRIGMPEANELPRPLGHFKSPFIRTDSYTCYVRFHAAWPVNCDDPGAGVVAYGLEPSLLPSAQPNNVPVILKRAVGKGWVVLVGDSGFAMNKNLERIDGRPIEGMRENSDFWRWFLTTLRGLPAWIPAGPAPAGATKPASAPAGGASSAEEAVE